jgi:hypothetical protein
MQYSHPRMFFASGARELLHWQAIALAWHDNRNPVTVRPARVASVQHLIMQLATV